MINKKILLTILCSVLLLWNCDECSTCTNPPGDEDKILVNTSFEKNGNPSADGWIITLGDFSTDTPAHGGEYSIFIEAGNPGGFVETQVAALSSMNIYHLSFWAKSKFVIGGTNLSFVRNGSVVNQKRLSIPDTIWTMYILTDTFQVNQGDSIRIQFYAGISPIVPGGSYFDLCKLEAIE